MRPSVPLLLNSSRWKLNSIEWSPKVANVHSQIIQEDNDQHSFVLPDLPNNVYTADDRQEYFSQIPKRQRIVTVATCRYTPETLVQENFPSNKLLLVGGNDKHPNSLSTMEAAKILLSSSNQNIELWGVTNPNDPKSILQVQEKIDSGIAGFLTQPLLSSRALDILERYPRVDDAKFVAGMAMPRSAKQLQFWCQLLQDEQLLENDPLFQAHLAFFSQPYYTSMAWIGRELEHLATSATIDGVHFMPLGNTEDLVTLFQRPPWQEQ